MNPDTLTRMINYGGSFARAIAQAWLVADPSNRARLEEAFPDLFNRYANMEHAA
jgi:hypothetical protein